MAQEIEIEFKNLVTEEEFTRLTSHFHINKEDFISQDNHYFDTPDYQLKEKQSALRIREKNGRYMLTLKTPLKEDLLETNQSLSKNQSDSLLREGLFPEGEVRDVLTSLSIPYGSLQHFGTLSTSRAEIPYRNGLLVFDQSSYLQKKDYELEYEVKERTSGEAIFLELLEQHKIPLRQTDNKIKRFYLEKLKRDRS
ncbi:CYTH domain-containing protein [Rossellomorea sp. SC111]|uniref:CYTH domain-containing protein n=1 Tax=Rossellomorea sp. SC111 TaxID=2968985 RepID=UPI00215B5353|nr:CYTH domain-containing protein [Rossellomorea sp. SC111]MCR8849065.1 CYTH domain-containing protein [Rossellomorea sp. SC111]